MTSAGWWAHSYIIYGPLIAGMATIMYEGLPPGPDAGIWWILVEVQDPHVLGPDGCACAQAGTRPRCTYDIQPESPARRASLTSLPRSGSGRRRPIIDNWPVAIDRLADRNWR